MPGGRAVPADEAIAALEGNVWSTWRNWGLGEGCRLIDEPELMRYETPLAHVPYNSVMRFRLDGSGHGDGDSDSDEAIDAVIATYQERGVPLVWLVHPTRQPHDLAGRLDARGLVVAEVLSGMVAPLDEIPRSAPAPDGVRVEEIHAGGEDPYLELLSWRYDLPPSAIDTLRSVWRSVGIGEPGAAVRCWVAYLDDRPVSKVALHCHGTTAGVYGVATRPEARGMGLGRLITTVALDAARETGSAVAVLHSTPMAIHLYETLGFSRVADFSLHAFPDTLHL